MKKHIQVIAGLFLLLSTTLLRAQDPGIKILQSVAESLKSHKNMEVAFTAYIKEEPGKPFEKKDGVVYIQANAYKMVFDDMELICDGTTLWTYYSEDQEVMVGNATEDNSVNLYFDLLTESVGGFQGTDDDGNSVIALYDKDEYYQDIDLVVDEKGTPKRIDFFGDYNEVVMKLELHSFKFDQTFKEGFFTFDEKAHPGVDLIDMR